MSKQRLRYTIEVGGQARKILSVSHQSTGLIFDHKPAWWHRAKPGSPDVVGRVEFDRATFHHSHRSPIGNLITRTSPRSGSLNRHTQFTLALKTNNNFAPLIARRFPNLSDWGSAPAGPNDISLGELDPVNFSLVTCLYIGNRDRIFSIHDEYLAEGVNVSEVTIADYKILLLYTFYAIQSIDFGTQRFYFTDQPKNLKDESHRKQNNFIMQGFDDYNVLEDFFRTETLFRREFSQLTGQGMGDRCGRGTLS
jgi:hypothetical protein